MGLDWRTLDLSAYFEALEANNEMHDPDAKRGEPEDTSALKRFMAAHGHKG